MAEIKATIYAWVGDLIAGRLLLHSRIMKQPVYLMWLRDVGDEKSRLSSDYAEATVPTRLFIRGSGLTAIMHFADAQRYGLEDGAT